MRLRGCRPNAGDLGVGGSLIAANSVNLTVIGTGGITNSGAIVANGNLGGANAGALTLRTTNPEADITNRGTLGGNRVVLDAGRDIQNVGGAVIARGPNASATLIAGRDVVG